MRAPPHHSLEVNDLDSIWSHEGRDLISHLTGVANILERLGMDYARYVGLSHDIAKAHPLFQKRLRENKGRFGHAAPSSLITYYWMVREGVPPSETFLMAEVVRDHHTGMRDLNDIVSWWAGDKGQEIEALEDISDYISRHVYSVDIDDLVNILEEVDDWFLDDILPQDDISQRWDFYFKYRTYLSMLVAADRVDAVFRGDADVWETLTQRDIDVALANIEDFVSHAPQSPINQWRKDIRRYVLDKFRETASGPSVVRLTLPTGAGKTLVSLQMALHYAKEIGARKIIYVLPFISTGVQVGEILATMFGSEDIVMVDNYLSGNDNDATELSRYDVLMTIMRYWVKPVVVTTAVYMWDVLFGHRAMNTMNFHLLKDSVIIFDEVQSIPTEYWKDLATVAEYLGKNNLVILMSATNPIEVSESINIDDGGKKIPTPRYDVDLIKLGESSVENVIEDRLISQITSGKSVMLLVNTRKKAYDLYRWLSSLFPHYEDKMYFLSTYVIPKHRKEVISRLKEAEKKGLQRILITTQVVEAGVDLSFDVLYREKAPIDSIIQSAGRCGRHGKIHGMVFVLDTNDTVGKVYGAIKKGVTDELLEREVFPKDEVAMEKLAREYFEHLKERHVTSTLSDEYIGKGFYNIKASLIDNNIPTVSVVIPVEDEVYDIVNAIRTLMDGNSQDKFGVLNRKKQYMKALSPYILGLYERQFDSVVDVNHYQLLDKRLEKIIVLDKEYIHHYYDLKVGWYRWKVDDTDK